MNQQTYSSDPAQVVTLWEQMGASTGGLIGRFIGLNFLMGSRVLSSFINPYGYSMKPINPMDGNQKPYYIVIQAQEDEIGVIENIIKANQGSFMAE